MKDYQLRVIKEMKAIIIFMLSGLFIFSACVFLIAIFYMHGYQSKVLVFVIMSIGVIAQLFNTSSFDRHLTNIWKDK